MGNSASNLQNTNQSVYNEIFSLANNTCNSSVSENNTDNTVNIVDSKTGNVILFNNTGNISASCAINQQISQQATAIIAASAKQKALAVSPMIATSENTTTNEVNQTQTVVNNLTSISYNMCNSTITKSNVGNTINVFGSTTQDINAFDIDNSDSNATCTISNIVSQVAYAKESAKSSQTATTMSSFAMIAIVIAICVILGIMSKIFLAKKSSGSDSNPVTIIEKTTEQKPPDIKKK